MSRELLESVPSQYLKEYLKQVAIKLTPPVSGKRHSCIYSTGWWHQFKYDNETIRITPDLDSTSPTPVP